MAASRGKNLYRLYVAAFCAVFVLLLQSVVLLSNQNEGELKANLLFQLGAVAIFALFSNKASGTYLNAPLVFATSIFIWHSAFLLGYYFELSPIFAFPGDTFDIGYDYIFKATALVGLCLALAIVGMLWGYRREQITAETNPSWVSFTRERYSYFQPGSKRIIWYLFAAMTVILLIFMVRDTASIFGHNYLDFYQQENLSLSATLFYRSEYLWAFVIVVMIAYHKDNVRLRIFLALMVVGVAVLLAMLGPRTGPFLCLTTLLLAWDCFVRRVKLRWVGLFVLFLSVASYVIASARDTGIGAHVFQFSDTGRDKVELLDLFYEQGKSIAVVLRTMEFTHQSGLVHGRTFLDAAVSVVPLPLLNLAGYHPAQSLTEFVVAESPAAPQYRGPGSSLIAEFYYNFGMLGCLGFAVIGWYISRAYFRYVISGDVFVAVKVMTVVGMYTVMMRDDIGSSLRLIVYAFIVLSLLRSREAVPATLVSQMA